MSSVMYLSPSVTTIPATLRPYEAVVTVLAPSMAAGFRTP